VQVCVLCTPAGACAGPLGAECWVLGAASVDELLNHAPPGPPPQSTLVLSQFHRDPGSPSASPSLVRSSTTKPYKYVQTSRPSADPKTSCSAAHFPSHATHASSTFFSLTHWRLFANRLLSFPQILSFTITILAPLRLILAPSAYRPLLSESHLGPVRLPGRRRRRL
jgi:hypothetical protein